MAQALWLLNDSLVPTMPSQPAFYDSVALSTLKWRGFESRFIETSLGRVHLLDAEGRGPLPPVVLLHGFSSAGVHFLPILGRLRRCCRRVIVPDLPAHGFSDAPRGPVRASALEAMLFEALDRVIDESVVLFGLSMGGAVAVRYALSRRDRVRGLMLCSPGGAAMDDRALARLQKSFRIDRHADALAFVDRLFAKPTLLRQAYAWGVKKSFERPAMRALIGSLRSEDLLRPEQLASLEVPVRIVWGQGDRVLPVECREFFRQHKPKQASFDEPEGFGHSPFLEEPRELARRIERFLEDVEAPRETNETAVSGAA